MTRYGSPNTASAPASLQNTHTHFSTIFMIENFLVFLYVNPKQHYMSFYIVVFYVYYEYFVFQYPKHWFNVMNYILFFFHDIIRKDILSLTRITHTRTSSQFHRTIKLSAPQNSTFHPFLTHFMSSQREAKGSQTGSSQSSMESFSVLPIDRACSMIQVKGVWLLLCTGTKVNYLISKSFLFHVIFFSIDPRDSFFILYIIKIFLCEFSRHLNIKSIDFKRFTLFSLLVCAPLTNFQWYYLISKERLSRHFHTHTRELSIALLVWLDSI